MTLIIGVKLELTALPIAQKNNEIEQDPPRNLQAKHEVHPPDESEDPKANYQ